MSTNSRKVQINTLTAAAAAARCTAQTLSKGANDDVQYVVGPARPANNNIDMHRPTSSPGEIRRPTILSILRCGLFGYKLNGSDHRSFLPITQPYHTTAHPKLPSLPIFFFDTHIQYEGHRIRCLRCCRSRCSWSTYIYAHNQTRQLHFGSSSCWWLPSNRRQGPYPHRP